MRSENFISFLREFATGAYLNEADRELWEPLYDPKAVDEIATALQQFEDVCDSFLSQHPSDVEASNAAEWLTHRISELVDKLNAINESHGRAVLDAEEHADIVVIINSIVEQFNARMTRTAPLDRVTVEIFDPEAGEEVPNCGGSPANLEQLTE